MSHFPENELLDVKDDILVSITLYGIHSTLVREFARKVVVHYRGGISEAIQDLMQRATME
jgi:hypothetical protein